ncbi:hypothetical protein [Streptomyces sp. NPDC019937]|uniref:hypothetical protein n=1 Tax=Streptomyces sp. NPDC019937 TaxID=3154787 RepID=UPI0033FCA2CE
MSDDEPGIIRFTSIGQGPDGRYYMPAEDVTALLRGIARAWTEHAIEGAGWRSPEGEEVELDPATLRTMARILSQQADSLEVQLIAHRTEEEPPPT